MRRIARSLLTLMVFCILACPGLAQTPFDVPLQNLPPANAISPTDLFYVAQGPNYVPTAATAQQVIDLALATGVTSFNTRTGPVTLLASDVGAVCASSAPPNSFVIGLQAGNCALIYQQPSFSNLAGTALISQLPIGTTSTPGILQPDGVSITVTTSGKIAAVTSGFGNVSGPNTSTSGNLACWNNSSGTLLSDCGARTLTFGSQTVLLGTSVTTQGNGSKVQLSVGTIITNDCMRADANGNTADAGGPCATFPNGGIVGQALVNAGSASTAWASTMSFFAGGFDTSQSINTTTCYSPNGVGTADSTCGNIANVAAFAGTLRNLYVQGPSPTSPQSITYTVIANGLATAIACSIANPNHSCNSPSGATANILPGQQVALRVAVSNAGSSVAFSNWGLELDTPANVTPACSNALNFSASCNSQYLALGGLI